MHWNISVGQSFILAKFVWMCQHRNVLPNTTWAQWVLQVAGIENKAKLGQIANALSCVVPKIIKRISEICTDLCKYAEKKIKSKHVCCKYDLLCNDWIWIPGFYSDPSSHFPKAYWFQLIFICMLRLVRLTQSPRPIIFPLANLSGLISIISQLL